MSKFRTESLDDGNKLGGTQTDCLRTIHAMVLYETTGERPAQSLMRDSDQPDIAFNRTIRSAQRAFWSNWQDHVSALSVLNPRVAAATVRRTFQPSGEDRQTQQVRWPDCPGGVAQCDSAAQWREHFSSVGVHSGNFDEHFFKNMTNTFL